MADFPVFYERYLDSLPAAHAGGSLNRNFLIDSHIKLVKKLALNFYWSRHGKGKEKEPHDLLQEAHLAMIEAIDKYIRDIKKGKDIKVSIQTIIICAVKHKMFLYVYKNYHIRLPSIEGGMGKRIMNKIRNGESIEEIQKTETVSKEAIESMRMFLNGDSPCDISALDAQNISRSKDGEGAKAVLNDMLAIGSSNSDIVKVEDKGYDYAYLSSMLEKLGEGSVVMESLYGYTKEEIAEKRNINRRTADGKQRKEMKLIKSLQKGDQ